MASDWPSLLKVWQMKVTIKTDDGTLRPFFSTTILLASPFISSANALSFLLCLQSQTTHFTPLYAWRKHWHNLHHSFFCLLFFTIFLSMLSINIQGCVLSNPIISVRTRILYVFQIELSIATWRSSAKGTCLPITTTRLKMARHRIIMLSWSKL